jgi:hypothetical protein
MYEIFSAQKLNRQKRDLAVKIDEKFITKLNSF